MADLQMVNSKDAERLGLSSTLVTREEWEAAKGQGAAAAAAVDAVLFEDGPQEPQEGAYPMPEVSVEAGVAKKARKPAQEG
jgi:hypothetical protein